MHFWETSQQCVIRVWLTLLKKLAHILPNSVGRVSTCESPFCDLAWVNVVYCLVQLMIVCICWQTSEHSFFFQLTLTTKNGLLTVSHYQSTSHVLTKSLGLYPRDAMLALYLPSLFVYVCLTVHLSVCPSVTIQCSTKTAKPRITQTMLHDSPGTV